VDSVPFQRLVKKVYTVEKKIKKEGEASGVLTLCEKKTAKIPKKTTVGTRATIKAETKKSVLTPAFEPSHKGFKKPMKVADDYDVEDVTDQVVAANLKMASSSLILNNNLRIRHLV